MTHTRKLALTFAALLAAPLAFGQETPPAPAPPSRPDAIAPPPPRAPHMDRKIVIERGGGGHGIVPPGTWWKNPDTVSRLSLTADQQRRMDDIFRQNRIQLIHMKALLEEEQINLEPLLNANPVDSGKAMAEISRIPDVRAELEKANARMLLDLRAVLTSDQWTKLQDGRERHGSMDLFRGDGGPGSFEFNFEGLNGLQEQMEALQDRLSTEQFQLAPERMQIPEIHFPAITIPQIRRPAISVPSGE